MDHAIGVLSLPRPQPVPLTKEGWQWWSQPVSIGSGRRWAEWWMRHRVPLTIPQLAGLILGRAPEHVSMTAMISLCDQVRRQQDRWLTVPLRGYRAVWSRTHVAWRFRLAMGKRSRADGLLRALMDCGQVDATWDSGFVEASLADRIPDRRGRRRAVRLALRRGTTAGYVVDLRRADVPPMGLSPAEGWMRAMGCEPINLKRAIVTHSALAVEAALSLFALRADAGDVAEVLGEEAQLSRSRSGRGRMRRGSTAMPTADVEVRLNDGRRLWTEVLSRNYRATDLVAKHRDMPVEVAYVATSRSVARRFHRACPGTNCYVL